MTMKKCITAIVLGLAVALGGVPGAVVPAAVEAAPGWQLAGKYRSYEQACRKADQLEKCNYEVCVKKQNGYWCVYCKQ
jgi:hypothetical protein